jgi:hypothetical protein
MFCKMLMVSMGAALALSPVAAYAQTRPARDKIATSSPDEERERVDPVAVGAIAGVGFPRPLAVEGLVKLHDRIALGLEYGVMPEITVAEINTRLWSVAGDLRVFPFGGMLFAGLRGGRQHIGADTTVPVDGRDAVAAVNVDSWYVNPRVGILWTSKLGLTLGTEAGVQVPIGSRVSTNLPRGTSDTVVSVADALGKQVIPTLDLIRVGFVR